MKSIMEEVLDFKLAYIENELDALRTTVSQQDQAIESLRSVQELMQRTLLEQQKQTNMMDKSSTLSTYVERRVAEGIQQVVRLMSEVHRLRCFTKSLGFKNK